MTAAGENLSPGERLLQARERAGLALNDLAERTKIPPASLQAIERDEYHKVSGDLYVKSFLRSYAKEVGLDPEEMIDCYLTFTGEAAGGGEGDAKAGWDEKDVHIRRVGLPWLRIGGGAVALLVLLAGAWFLLGPGGEGPEVPTGSEQGPGDAIETAAGAADRPDTLAVGWQNSAPRQDENSSPRQDGETSGEPDLRLPAALSGLPELVFAEGRTWPFVLRLLVPEPGDFAVMRDAETGFQAARFPSGKDLKALPESGLEPGRAYAVQEGLAVYWGVEDHISLRLGKVADVELSFNGHRQDLSRFRDGEVLLLDASDLESPSGE